MLFYWHSTYHKRKFRRTLSRVTSSTLGNRDSPSRVKHPQKHFLWKIKFSMFLWPRKWTPITSPLLQGIWRNSAQIRVPCVEIPLKMRVGEIHISMFLWSRKWIHLTWSLPQGFWRNSAQIWVPRVEIPLETLFDENQILMFFYLRPTNRHTNCTSMWLSFQSREEWFSMFLDRS